jgi:hypothetical protein
MSSEQLTPAEKSALKIRIAKLEIAYEDIISGRAVKRFVDQNGEQVEYTTANASSLLAYIQTLKAKVDCGFAKRFRPRPIGFLFPR